MKFKNECDSAIANVDAISLRMVENSREAIVPKRMLNFTSECDSGALSCVDFFYMRAPNPDTAVGGWPDIINFSNRRNKPR